MAVNKFTDWTDQEFKAMLGNSIRPLKKRNSVPSQKFDQERIRYLSQQDVDWRTKGIVTKPKDQGACGSCWAFGSTETFESYWALATRNLVALSEQQILDCTPNPDQCGGTGGCGGGTAELAFAQIIKSGGLSTAADYPYESGAGENFPCRYNGTGAPKMSSYVSLPANDHDAVLNWVATKGPLAVSVDAMSWSSYGSGVFDGCDNEHPDLDHLVQLVGFGTDPRRGDFWLVRNSWSSSWGESGYIRIKRHSAADTPCGIDTKPSDGDGCINGPPTIKVCGNCGILYDGVYTVVKK